MHPEAQQWITALDLSPHPEGGFYKRQLHSPETLQLPDGRQRPRFTTIHFLLTDKTPSRFHRLLSDEIWFYHAGAPLTLHQLLPTGEHRHLHLGPNPSANQHLQLHIPANTIFGASTDTPDSYTLISCLVTPGFDFADFELLTRPHLLSQFPQHPKIIHHLTTP